MDLRQHLLKEFGIFAAVAFFAGILDEKLTLSQGGGGEGVGFADVGSGLEEAAVNVADYAGSRDGEDIAIIEQVFVVGGEPSAACVGFGQTIPADGRAHGPVEDEDSVLEGAGEFGGLVRLEHCG